MNYQSLPIQLLPGIPQVMPEHNQAGQQPDNLCGPFWVAILLRSQGIITTPEQIAQLAGSVLPIGNPGTWLPQGAISRQDYCLSLPTTPSLEDAGTSVQGLIRAVAEISQGTYTLLPLQTQWTADRLFRLIQLCQQHPDWSAVPLCNLRTGHLWGSHLATDQAMAYLEGQPIQPPAPDWNVGHFLTLAGIAAGQANTLLWVGDTYPIFGWQGYHLQPADRVAQALNRGDGYQGGILLFVATPHRDTVAQIATAEEWQVGDWDNGSSDSSISE